jgi:alkanesulfonate monooxygenase SsuD/methylene tetrahydromethanopterin reductase-like flavin-dependent oxidoreductase (luciferase family)
VRNAPDLYVNLGPAGSLDSLRDRVARFDDLGVTGVLVSDHLFVSLGPERAKAYRPDDPFVVLAAVAALSPRLAVGTLVANVGLSHPALVLRHFAQLAALVGGERVLAGLGAGWNGEEFESLGMRMPSHSARLDRLEEACRLARALFAEGVASLDGSHVVARGLPLAPRPATPPRLLLGGGSDRLLGLAGRHADIVDLNGSSRRQRLGRTTPLRDDRIRRRSTTVADLTASAAIVRAAAAAASRPCPRFSVTIDSVSFGGDPDPALASCPYVLAGDTAKLRDQLDERVERIGLDALVVPESAHLARMRAELLR